MASALLNMLKSIPLDDESEASALLKDGNYIRKSSLLVNDALQRGLDVMQMPDGDVMITEVKTVTYKYSWDAKKGKFERAYSGSRKRRKSKGSK